MTGHLHQHQALTDQERIARALLIAGHSYAEAMTLTGLSFETVSRLWQPQPAPKPAVVESKPETGPAL